MQTEVYVSSNGTHPARTLALRPCSTQRLDASSKQGQILYFSPHEQPAATGRSQVSVRLEPASGFEQTAFRKLQSRPVFGCLGLMHHANDTFLALVTGCVKVGDIRLGESVYKIVAVRFFSLTGNTPDEDMIPAPYNPETANENEGPTMMPHPCRELEKVLCNGAFFFSPQFDLTRALKMQEEANAEANMNYDEKFLWNYFMLKELLTYRSHLDEQEREELDYGGLLVHIIQGYVGCQAFRTQTTQGQLSVISRLSSKRAGTRYNTRGIDDTGSVANFVETETILSNSEWCFAYTQIRGSVPVFWEQQGLQLASHKIQLSRGPEATKPAVRRHFEELIQKYEDVHILDLLGSKDQGEVTLSQEYRNQVEDLGSQILKNLHMTRFDYHSQVKGGNYDQLQSLLQHVRGDSERYGYFYHDLLSNTIVQTQRGVFRTNCLDCLDRTNVIQSNLSKEALESLLDNLLPQDSRFGSLMLMHSELWADNGDMLSKIYTGTGALKSEVTRSGKMSFASMLGDATKSINRFYINNFQDKDRQEVIDVLLGKMAHQVPVAIHDPVHDSIASEMKARLGEYSQQVQIDVFVGTYNLNGKAPSGESLEAWLCFDKDVPEPDLYVIGFQEIVKLTPKQIMATDENKRRVWEQEVERTINRRGGSRYIQLRSGQLVGAALMIYVKEQNAPFIRNVECSIKKTGMGGMAGNKGAVAIRMDYYESTLCLVTSHLASGQENLQERNNDFHTINDGIAFARGRTISSHDIILWCGDFNYRVDMENDQIRALVSQGNYFEIFRCDQLKRSIDYGEAFYGYKEGIIAFAPTYRYDIGTDNYDTSEKYRAPAWTDRILYRGRGIYQTSYERAEFRTSDHRPVMSMFVLELTMLDSAAKEQMEQTLYRKSSSRSLAEGLLKDGKRDAPGPAPRGLVGYNAEKLRNGLAFDPSYDRIPSAPKPSSDSQQWWNDPLEDGVQRIPSGKKNPFEGDRTITATDRAVSSSRPAPAPPTSVPAKKQPAVDLLGASEQIDAPVLSLTGKTTAGTESGLGNVHVSTSALAATNSVKRSAPPPPVNRRRAGLPAATLPASTVIHSDKDAARRPAPPPPRRAANGAVGASRDDTDDDDDDDDDDDSDDNDGPGVERGGDVEDVKPTGGVATKEPKESTNEEETLWKPSQLKKQQLQQQQMPETPSSTASVFRKINKDVEMIRPSLSSSSSSSTASTSSVPLATIAANKSKVLLPGFDARGGGPQPHKGPTIVSMGLGLSSAGVGSPNGSKSPGTGFSSGSVLQRTKEFNSTPSRADPASTSSAAPGSLASKTGATGKGQDKEKGAAADEMETSNAVSVSELKKSFGVVSGSPSTLPVSTSKSGTPSAAAVSVPSNSVGTNKSSHGIMPVIPMVKPLSFSPSGVSGSTDASSKAKTTGFGAVQSGLALKPTSGSRVAATGTGRSSSSIISTGSKDHDGAVEDVKPASGSVKQAIAALKGQQGVEEVSGAKATEGEGTEDDKVDAFAYWKSK
ncbi:inositol polyphosphate 5-phosphatase [Mortierella alpina]|nr:inositol polyphosphate 5-phosphatase [Mortierella alpina]